MRERLMGCKKREGVNYLVFCTKETQQFDEVFNSYVSRCKYLNILMLSSNVFATKIIPKGFHTAWNTFNQKCLHPSVEHKMLKIVSVLSYVICNHEFPRCITAFRKNVFQWTCETSYKVSFNINTIFIFNRWKLGSTCQCKEMPDEAERANDWSPSQEHLVAFLPL